MNQETRALIEILRDETQSRAVFDRCNEVLAAWSDLDLRAKINAAHPGFWVGEFKPEDVKIEGTVVVRNTTENDEVLATTGGHGLTAWGSTPAAISETGQVFVVVESGEIHADEAEVEIITGERKVKSTDDYIAELEAILRLAMPIVEEVAGMFADARDDGDKSIKSMVGSKFDKRVTAAVDSDGWMELSTRLDAEIITGERRNGDQ